MTPAWTMSYSLMSNVASAETSVNVIISSFMQDLVVIKVLIWAKKSLLQSLRQKKEKISS